MSDPIHVLYVDDEPVLLDIGKLYLEQDGQFRVTGLSSAEEALTTLKEGSFDAIVPDYMMPEVKESRFLRRSEIVVFQSVRQESLSRGHV
jgi:CheY-like chemotaxis protein